VNLFDYVLAHAQIFGYAVLAGVPALWGVAVLLDRRWRQ
jgi:hypothetical protein